MSKQYFRVPQQWVMGHSSGLVGHISTAVCYGYVDPDVGVPVVYAEPPPDLLADPVVEYNFEPFELDVSIPRRPYRKWS